MEPTILEGEKVSAEMRAFQPSRGALVIFQQNDQLLIKRVIAVGGDVVEGRDLQILVNGKLLEEPYVQHVGPRPLGRKTLETFAPIRVPEGQLFVAGDNRDYSFDSRDPQFGLVSSENVKGAPLTIVASKNPQRVGKPLH